MKYFFTARQGCRALRMVEIGAINENVNGQLGNVKDTCIFLVNMV